MRLTLIRRTAAVAAALVVAISAAGCASSRASRSPATPTGVTGTTASVGALRISGAYIPAPASPDVAAAYFAVRNTGDAADELTSLSADVSGDVGLHDYAGDRMRLLSHLSISAHTTTTLAVGKTHVMVMNARPALRAGSTVALTLRFSRAGPVTVRVPVVAATGPHGSDAPTDHMRGMTS